MRPLPVRRLRPRYVWFAISLFSIACSLSPNPDLPSTADGGAGDGDIGVGAGGGTTGASGGTSAASGGAPNPTRPTLGGDGSGGENLAGAGGLASEEGADRP